MNVIEVDQWTSSGDVEQADFETFNLAKVKGGDSEAVKVIFGGHFTRRTVDEGDIPSTGNVWYIKGLDGKCKLWRYNYDSSG